MKDSGGYMLRAIIVGLISTCLLTRTSPAQDATAAADTSKVTVRGVLVDTEGAALAGKTVFYVWRDKGGKMLLLYGFSKAGTLALDPSADTDAMGRFSLELFPLQKGDSVELGVADPRQPRRSERSLGMITIDKLVKVGGVRTADIGKVVVK